MLIWILCDFLVRQGGSITEAYQVSVSLAETKTRKREIDGLAEAMDVFGLTVGYIITLDETEEINFANGKTIHVLPYYRWCLD